MIILFLRIADEMKTEGSVEYNSEASTFQDLKPRRPTINRLIEHVYCKWFYCFLLRIADEMKPEGNFHHETESNALVDFKPQRPVINRWLQQITTSHIWDINHVIFRIKDSMWEISADIVLLLTTSVHSMLFQLCKNHIKCCCSIF